MNFKTRDYTEQQDLNCPRAPHKWSEVLALQLGPFLEERKKERGGEKSEGKKERERGTKRKRGSPI